MLEAIGIAISNLSDPLWLLLVLTGVMVGLILGVIPGVGGLTGMAIVLPFTIGMEPSAAIGLLIGITAVVTTSDTVGAVLFSVPGTSGSQATVMDGHPMARAGKANVAFGAAYVSSMLGGSIGAMCIFFAVPILRPLILAFGSPEFFMLAIMGVVAVGVFSSGALVKGLAAGALGFVLGMVGLHLQTAAPRWVFGQIYLWDGLPLVPVVLGMFAFPELVSLAIKGTSIAGEVPNVSGRILRDMWTGMRAPFRHWFLVLRSALIGTWIGFIPGLGHSVVDWLAYGHARQTEKGAWETFGKGDIRGVIAPESANNAHVGGAVIPTIAFGVPGSGTMAVFLVFLMLSNIRPGPSLLNENVAITYTIVLSLFVANIVGAAICLGATGFLSKLASVKIHRLLPVVLVIVFLASFNWTRSLADIVVLLLVGTLAFFMRRFGWARPPLVLGFILSPLVETNFFISMAAYGLTWLYRPLVIFIGLLIIGGTIFGIILERKPSQSEVRKS